MVRDSLQFQIQSTLDWYPLCSSFEKGIRLMYARILTKALVIVLIVMKFQCYAYGLDEALKRRFLEEYPKAQQAIDAKLAVSTLHARTTKTGAGSQAITIVRDHDCERATVKIQGSTPKTESFEVIHVSCPDRYFALRKLSTEEKYSVENLGKSPREVLSYQSTVGRLAQPQSGTFRSLVANTIKFKDAKITDIAVLPENPKLVKVRFEIVYGVNRDFLTFVLDTDNYWAVVSEERTVGDNPAPAVQMTVEYGEKSGGFAMPSKVKFAIHQGPWDEYVYDEWTFEPTDKSEFSMSRFGLPEIESISAEGMKFRNRIALGVVIALIIAGIALFISYGRTARSDIA